MFQDLQRIGFTVAIKRNDDDVVSFTCGRPRRRFSCGGRCGVLLRIEIRIPLFGNHVILESQLSKRRFRLGELLLGNPAFGRDFDRYGEL